MARKKLTTEAFDVKSSLPEGSEFTGYFLGAKAVKTKHGTRDIYSFKLADGSVTEIWGFASLNQGMEHANPGDRIFITRKKDYQARGKTCMAVTVEADTDDRIEIEE